MIARRALLAGPLLLALPAAAATPPDHAAADRADIARIGAWLNALRSLKARFIQAADSGQISRGTAWLVRPGRMRFEYDKPSPLLLVAGGGQLTFHDSELGQTTTIPLARTPLGILLAERIDLDDGSLKILAVERDAGLISLTLTRAATPGEGSLTLIFRDRPLLLAQWIVTDAQRRQTRVSLSDMQFGGTYPDSLFSVGDQ